MATSEDALLVSDKTSWQATRPLYYSCIVFIIIDTLIVALKTYSRLGIAKLRFWWDDFWIILAFVMLMPICAIGMAMVDVEVGWDNRDRIITNLEENSILLKLIYALLQFLMFSYALTRYSILALYLRIFTGKKLRIAVWVIIGFVTIQWLGFAITAILQCQPVQYYWDRTIPNGKCLDVDIFYRSVTPFNLFVDVILVCVPLPTVWQLKASTNRKWALTFLFGIGMGALVASAIRFTVYETHTAKYIAPTYTNVMIMWLVVEPSIYLIVACLPAMHHIIAAAVPRSFSEWMAERMANLTRIHSSLGRSKSRGSSSPHSDSRGLTDDSDFVLELSPPSKTSQYQAKSFRDDSRNSSNPWLRMQKDGIVVTKEVTLTVTQEERIEQVLGF